MGEASKSSPKPVFSAKLTRHMTRGWCSGEEHLKGGEEGRQPWDHHGTHTGSQ